MRIVTLVLLGLLMASGSAFGVLVDFDSDLEGMDGDTFDPGPRPPYTNNDPVWQNSAGSGGATGWAGCQVITLNTTVGGPYLGMNKGTNTDLAGNWITKYGGGGTELTLSIDVGSSAAVAQFNGLSPRIISGNSDWIYDGLGAGSLAVGWTTLSLTFDTAWTDAQAVAAGWRHIDYGAPPAEMLFSVNATNVGHFEFKYRKLADNTGQLPDGAMFGFDNIDITPEPVTLSMLALGGIAALLRRRS